MRGPSPPCSSSTATSSRTPAAPPPSAPTTARSNTVEETIAMVLHYDSGIDQPHDAAAVSFVQPARRRRLLRPAVGSPSFTSPALSSSSSRAHDMRCATLLSRALRPLRPTIVPRVWSRLSSYRVVAPPPGRRRHPSSSLILSRWLGRFTMRGSLGCEGAPCIGVQGCTVCVRYIEIA